MISRREVSGSSSGVDSGCRQQRHGFLENPALRESDGDAVHGAASCVAKAGILPQCLSAGAAARSGGSSSVAASRWIPVIAELVVESAALRVWA
jgi:hypothetical protein